MSRILNMIVRGVVRASRATNGFFRELTMTLPADDPSDVQHFQVHGLESRPSAGSEAIVFAMSGNADHLVALIAGSSSLDLAVGETALKNEHGWSIQMKQDRVDVVREGVSRMKVTETEIVLGGNPAAPLVARVGDAVQIIIPGGPAAGTYAGTILSSTSTVRAG